MAQTPRPISSPTALSAGLHERALVHDGQPRFYLMHVPARWDASKPTAVVLALHGGGGDMRHQASDRHYGLLAASERDGYVVVFPNGVAAMPGQRFATWNAGNCCGKAVRDKADDVGFLRAVVDDVKRQMAVDAERVLSMGMSNGAMMSYRLACEMPDVIRGVMAVAGTDGSPSCAPQRAVSILHVHALNDDHVPFEGGRGPATRDPMANHTSVAATVAKWVKLNACAPEPKRVLSLDGARCDLYEGCKEGTRVQWCVTERGGHSWPGGEKTMGKEPTSKAIIANDVFASFFGLR
jgi:polyhydroxybutyrate depolymerase